MNSKTGGLTPAVRTRSELLQQVTAWKQAGERVGFVPTMGALHGGHLSLIEKAKEKATRIVASIFVNPTQFAPGEDFDTYPRDEEADLAKLASVGCDLAYLPTVGEMYPEGSVTNVRVEEMSDLLDGIYRPHFFYGVTTVVARLFLHVQPDVAVFGEKDYQQLQIIRRMVRDLGFPIEIIGASTARDADGLAQSSRNLYLKPEERRNAGAMQQLFTGPRSGSSPANRPPPPWRKPARFWPGQGSGRSTMSPWSIRTRFRTCQTHPCPPAQSPGCSAPPGWGARA